MLVKYVLSFLWELIMDKTDKKDGSRSTPSWKKLLVFAILSSSIVLNGFTVERLYKVSKSHIEVVKKLKELTSSVNADNQCKSKLEQTEKFLGACMTGKGGH